MEELRSVVAQTRGVSTSEVDALVFKKRKEFAELLSEESALKIVARETGVDVKEDEVRVQFQSLESIGQTDVPVNVFVRIQNVFAPREFQTQKRRGRVCNVSVADSSKKANLVLWDKDVDLVEGGKIERNDLLEVSGAKVKSVDPLELNASFLTQLNVLKGDELDEEQKSQASGIAKANVVVKKLGELSVSDSEFDAFARTLKVGQEREFSKRDGRIGKVASLIVSDGTGQLRLVLWDKNADLVRRVKVGDAIKIESGYVKEDRDGNLEVHMGWRGRVVLHPKNHGLAQKETLWKEHYKTCSLADLQEQGECIVSARLKSFENARVVLKCKKCNASMNQKACGACGSKEHRQIVVVNAVLEDSSGVLNSVFFGAEALDVLGLKSLTVDASVVLDLKKEYLIGRNLTLVLSGKKNLSGDLEAVCRHVISTSQTEEVSVVV